MSKHSVDQGKGNDSLDPGVAVERKASGGI